MRGVKRKVKSKPRMALSFSRRFDTIRCKCRSLHPRIQLSLSTPRCREPRDLRCRSESQEQTKNGAVVFAAIRYNPPEMPLSPSPDSAVAIDATVPRTARFALPRDVTAAERRTLVAGGLGWMLDAMDVMLFSLVLAFLVREFSMDTRTAGFLNSLTLIASAVGGFLFGFLADRIGRHRALMALILVYSLSSAACAFTHAIPQLAFFRFVLGLGMGGEWTTAAALIAETWRAEHRDQC